MGTFSWLTSDTEESISCRDERPVYLLQPNGEAPICEPRYGGFGEFGGVDAYEWLATRNLAPERLASIDQRDLRGAGVSLAHTTFFLDSETGARIAIFHRHALEVDPTLTFFPIKYSDPIPGYNGLSANELRESGRFVSKHFELTFPLKFSFDANARYEDLPAAETCPHQGYPPRKFDMTQSSLCNVNVVYGEAHPFWDVYFTPLQLAYAETTCEEINRISVMIEEDGKLALNAGHAEGSPEREDEQSLFESMQLAIVEALTRELPADNPAYAAFLDDAKEFAEDRHDGLFDLEQSIAEFKDEFEE